MKKPKPRYAERCQILAKIDEVRRQAADKLTSAAALESLAHEQYKMMGMDTYQRDAAVLKELADDNMDKSERLRVTATNLLEGKLKLLGAKLSEFDTLPMPGVLADATVEAI